MINRWWNKDSIMVIIVVVYRFWKLELRLILMLDMDNIRKI